MRCFDQRKKALQIKHFILDQSISNNSVNFWREKATKNFPCGDFNASIFDVIIIIGNVYREMHIDDCVGVR